MCVIFLSLGGSPNDSLVIAANRDEFYRRPSAPLGFWADAPEVLAGRDLEKGGAWLGVTKHGRFAALTNFRDPLNFRSGKVSRGQIVSDFLRSSEAPDAFLERLHERNADYPDFNLLCGRITPVGAEAFYYGTRDPAWRPLSPGTYGLSNHVLDTDWPKLKRGKDRFRKILELSGDSRTEARKLFELLTDRTVAADPELPDTGVGLDRERLLSPIFIQSPAYGTVSSAVILVRASGELLFEERSFGPEGETGSRRVEIQLETDQPG